VTDQPGFLLRENIDALAIKRVLGKHWLPPKGWADDCWWFDSHPSLGMRIIVSGWVEPDGTEWVHASISRYENVMPTYDDLKLLHQAVFREGYSYQCFVPPKENINIKDNVLHLWGRLDGKPALPDFGRFGTI
jgi:hypothetical protein